MADPRLPPIPQPVADPASINAVLVALKLRVENITTVVVSGTAPAAQTVSSLLPTPQLPSGQYAPIRNPHFQGEPTAPTAPLGTNTDQLATMAALHAAVLALTVGGSVEVVFNQVAPAAVWVIAHGLGRHPEVVVVTTANEMVEGDVLYLDENTVRVSFAAGFAGSAYLN